MHHMEATMGGYGSTRWNWERARTDTAGLLKLDVRWLAHRGCLNPGTVCTLNWSRGDGEPAGNIWTRMDWERPCLTLEYATRRDGNSDWVPHRDLVWLDSTPCTYGGTRDWFSCPHCDARRAVLYSMGGEFACRACHDLAYASTREDDADRCDRRIRRLAEQLGSDGNGRRGFLWTMPDRPKGMHWTTYERLARQLLREHQLRDDLFTESAARILAYSKRIVNRRG